MSSAKKTAVTFIGLTIILCSLSGCLTPKKLDRFVASQFNNELPRLTRKKNPAIDIKTLSSWDNSSISTTVHKTDKFLPLLFYWKYDHRLACSLNTAIPATHFTNAINADNTKALIEKLSGQNLELTIEQAPSGFSIVAKENMIWLVYAYSWAKIYIEPDFKDLVVSYKLTGADKTLKAGKITVKNTEKNKGLGFFQSLEVGYVRVFICI